MLIYLEGNIGSGKSTFIKFLNNKLKEVNIPYVVLPEPVKEWENLKDSSGKNVLEHYYDDIQKMAFPFQMNAFISRLKGLMEIKEKNPNKIIFVERSVFTDRNVFTKLNYENGNLSEIEYNIYNEWFEYFVDKFDLRPNGYIYLDTEYHVCNQRIKSRNRNGESNIPLKYLEQLEIYHNKLLLDENENNGIKILKINSNIDFFQNEKLLDLEINKIAKFLIELSN